MQQTADEIIEKMVLSDLSKNEPNEQEDTPDFGFNYPFDYVLDTYIKYHRHGTLPESGAYNDQDPKLVQEDWSTVTERYNYFMALHTEHRTSIAAPQANDWADLL